MRRIFLFLFLFMSFGCSFAFSAQKMLHEADIRTVMNRLFSFHIENKEMTPLLVRRCFKLYIEQFDAEKAYLLDSEVHPWLNMDDSSAQQVIYRMSRGDYSDFRALNEVMQQAVLRSQKIRKNWGDLVLRNELELSAPRSPPPSHYATNLDEIAERQKSRMAKFYLYHQTRSNLSGVERKAKFLSLYENKVRRGEYQVLFLTPDGKEANLARREHLFSLRILKSFAKSLDTHTSFFSPEEVQEMRLSLEKQFEGVGVVLFEGIDGVVISDLVKGSPAEQSGKIQVNDLLVEINGMQVDKLSFDEVLDLLKEHGKMVLGFQRMDEAGRAKQFRVSLEKRPIVMNEERIKTSWEKVDGGIIGKISLYSFYETSTGESCDKDIKNAIREFQEIGPLRGLVLDLRENAGGFLSQAVKVSGLFLSNGVVVISKYGTGELHYLRNIVGRSFFTGPLVVLTSKMSASAAEIVAQALQDYGVGIVVGDARTFGKGSIQLQTITDPHADLFFKVTVGKYYTASGRTTQIEGVKADIVVPTHYAPYNIGERYLEYPLPADSVEPAFVDPLNDLDASAKRLFQRKYMPYLQRVVSFWKRMLPTLRKNSAERLARNTDFQLMLRKHEQVRTRLSFLPPNSIDEAPQTGGADLHMIEAVHIVEDMIQLEKLASPVQAAQYEPLLKTAS